MVITKNQRYIIFILYEKYVRADSFEKIFIKNNFKNSIK